MAKFAKKKTHSALYIIPILLLAVLAFFLLVPRALFFFSDQTVPSDPADHQIPVGSTETFPEHTQSTDAADEDVTVAPVETTAPPTLPSEPEDPHTEASISFPMLLEDARICIGTPFPYDGLNPDYDFQEGRGIAGIVLQNQSKDHLEYADVTMTAADGTEILFHAEQIPAGRSVMLFAVDNSPLPEDESWSDIRCDAMFAEGDLTNAEGVSVSVDELNVTIKNDSGKDIEHLVFYCHCPLGDEYFGGNVYQYEINDLSVNESVTVEAVDCILGIIEVVRIDTDRE